MKQKSELKLYGKVAEYIKKNKNFRCKKTFLNKGTKYGRIDVIGLRYQEKEIVGEDPDTVEIIAVEVKKNNKNARIAFGQAYSYAIFANRCYVAIKHDEKLEEGSGMARRLQVGLIHIKNNRCKEIESSPYHQTSYEHKRHLLDKLGYLYCNRCNEIFEKKGSSWDFKKAISQGKAYKDEDYYPLFCICKKCMKKLKVE